MSDAALKELQALPNIGPRMAADLIGLGIRSKADLKSQNPRQLYDRLCAKTGSQQDPCVLDTLPAVVDHANGAPAKPWWHYSRIRKAG